MSRKARTPRAAASRVTSQLLRATCCMLPRESRARYLEEFSAEMETRANFRTKIAYILSVASGSFSMRTALMPDAVASRGFSAVFTHRLSFAASLAFLVLIVSSVLVAGSYEAKPGGVLFPITRLVFAEKARSAQATVDVTTGVDRTRSALRSGHTAEAKAAMKVTIAQLPAINAEDGRDVLLAQAIDVAAQLQVPGPVSSGAAENQVSHQPTTATGASIDAGG